MSFGLHHYLPAYPSYEPWYQVSVRQATISLSLLLACTSRNKPWESLLGSSTTTPLAFLSEEPQGDSLAKRTAGSAASRRRSRCGLSPQTYGMPVIQVKKYRPKRTVFFYFGCGDNVPPCGTPTVAWLQPPSSLRCPDLHSG